MFNCVIYRRKEDKYLKIENWKEIEEGAELWECRYSTKVAAAICKLEENAYAWAIFVKENDEITGAELLGESAIAGSTASTDAPTLAKAMENCDRYVMEM